MTFPQKCAKTRRSTKRTDLNIMKKCAIPHAESVAARERDAPQALVYDGTLFPQVEERGYFDALIPARTLMTASS